MRPLLFLWCAIRLAGQGTGDDSAHATVSSLEQGAVRLAHAWIKDPQPLHRAWAAELIRRHELPGMDRELISALGDPRQLAALPPVTRPNDSISDEDRVRLAVLDALIQLGVHVPSNVGLALLARYPAQSAILLYRYSCPTVNMNRDVIRGSKTDETWLLAAECLAGEKKGGAVELLEGLHVTAEVTVLDPNRGLGKALGGGSGVHGGLVSGIVTRSDWPQFHCYGLVTGWGVAPGQVLLRMGIYPVYYTRQAGVQPWDPADSPARRNRNESILEILAEHLEVKREVLRLESHPSAQLHWTTAEQYGSDLRAFVADQQQRYEELLSLLLRHRLLTSFERERCQLALDIAVVDTRSSRSQPIPIIGVGDHAK